MPTVKALIAMLVVMAAAMPARGQTEADARKKVDASMAALKAGEYEKALEGFRDAEVSFPESSELAYNRGVALYRLGDFDEAKEAFASALSTRDLALEQKAKFNLGNCAYSQSLQKLTDYAGAIEDLRRAIDYYRDALELDPDDQDARANIETAYLLIKDLLDKKKQEEEKKKQEEPPTSQPSQCSQPSEGQDQQQQEQDGQQQQQEQSQQQQQKQQQQGGEQEQSKQEQSSQPQNGELESENPQDKQEQQQQAGKPQEQDMRKMTREEAARLLQAVRDRERERRDEVRRRQMLGRPPVDKDW
ncbi:MAG: tetratricopeptide repeat protein [Phycisphaerae bacterium]|nr:tetratricopeptide repeat protein [Phycisphaerae bacterium]